MKKISFLTLPEVTEIHNDQIITYGGEYGIRDIKLLDSALAQPMASFGGEWLHKNLFEMAASYKVGAGHTNAMLGQAISAYGNQLGN